MVVRGVEKRGDRGEEEAVDECRRLVEEVEGKGSSTPETRYRDLRAIRRWERPTATIRGRRAAITATPDSVIEER
jgi:hypothetical protein